MPNGVGKLFSVIEAAEIAAKVAVRAADNAAATAAARATLGKSAVLTIDEQPPDRLQDNPPVEKTESE